MKTSVKSCKFKDKESKKKRELSDKHSYETASSGRWLTRAKNTGVCCSEQDIQLPPQSPVTVERMFWH